MTFSAPMNAAQSSEREALERSLGCPGDDEAVAALERLADSMLAADQFYDSLGGIIGYQAKCLELIRKEKGPDSAQSSSKDIEVAFHRGICASQLYRNSQAVMHRLE